MGSPFTEVFKDVVGLFLPRLCGGCDRPLMRAEAALCLACAMDLPRNRFHDDPMNPVERLFHGRLSLEAASAFLRFEPRGMVQRLLHRLKYNGDEAIGHELGRRMGDELQRSMRFASVDAALAVPLHPRKERQRGYNQSQVLVDGITEVSPIRSLHRELVRGRHTASQTRRGRMDRWTNVQEAFTLRDPGALQGLHVLIVDDVVTTGATIESCAQLLAQVPGVRISVFTCASA
ncbi:MAG TPA: phosphoribosyltransferase family protein [Flavobacteriales bacterium]